MPLAGDELSANFGYDFRMSSNSRPTDFPYLAPQYLSPVLRILADGAEHDVEEIRERILAKFPLTPEQRLLKHPGFPITVFVNKVAYAFARLVLHEAIVDKSGRGGSYRITDHGRSILARHPTNARERDL